MMTINIAELKANLSRCLRDVAAGEHILVMDRRRPVAEIVPLSADRKNVWANLARTRGVRLGTQKAWRLKFSALKKRIDVAKLVREGSRDSVE